MVSFKSILPGAMSLFAVTALCAAGGPAAAAAPGLHAALSDAKWQELDNKVDRGLAWIAAQQEPNGSFGGNSTAPSAEPAVTSLCIMAFLSRGHLPGYGPYGGQIEKAIDFVINCQKSDGLFSYLEPEPVYTIRGASVNGTYTHAIAGLMLGEVYGHVSGRRMKEVKLALEKALAFTRALQTREKPNPEDVGGWRYLRVQYSSGSADSDMSVTAWHLMFLRSARNAEFNVPQTYIDDAMAYVHRSFDNSEGIFYYLISGPQAASRYTRGLVGAGIVSLSLAGEHQTPMALQAGNWLLTHAFTGFGETAGSGFGGRGGSDRFYYSTYYCSQAAAQLGGRYWEAIFPPLAEAVMSGQNNDGSWPIIGGGGRGFGGRGGGASEAWVGPVYPTAMAVLSLTPAYQLLPVYQH